MRNSHTIILLMFAAFSLGCGGSKSVQITKSTAINPNGDTELALLMREMYADGMQMKAAIENGDAPESHIDVSRLAVAEATVPAKVASQEFQAYAIVYQSLIQSMHEAEDEDKIGNYRALVNTCVTCHAAFCPGPLERIKKMELSNAVSD